MLVYTEKGMLTKVLELYSFRELILNLAKKDFKVRYKNAVLGFLWALLNPLFMMVILSIVFSIILRIQVEKYPVFLLTALIPWTFFALSISSSTTSIVDNKEIIKKVYFPREIIPISINLANLYNFLLSLIVLFLFLLIFDIKITWHILLLPFIILLQLTFTIGLSLIISSLHTYYRDVRYIVEALLMLWFYATPVFYPLTMVPKRFLKIYMLNPMADIVTMYRNILIDGEFPHLMILTYGIATSILILIIGIMVFRRLEPNFADVI